MSPIRVAVVSGYFVSGRGYQENSWAEQLARRGYAVQVFASRFAPAGLPHDAAESMDKFEKETIPALRLPRDIFVAPSLGARVAAFNPDWIFWFGAAQHFGRGLLRTEALGNAVLVPFFSETPSGREYEWRKKGIGVGARVHALAYRILRGGIVRDACRRAAIVVANTPSTSRILVSLFSPRERDDVRQKIQELPLGFAPDVFGFDATLRTRTRAELGLRDDHVLICLSSRFASAKRARIRFALRVLERVLVARSNARLVVVGLGQDELTREVRRVVSAGAFAGRVIMQDLASRIRLNAVFNAADICLFTAASISCQESLATGAVGCFADDGSTTHLRRDPEQISFFVPDDESDLHRNLESALTIFERADAGARLRRRERFAAASRWLGYDRIADTLCAGLESGFGASSDPAIAP